MPKAADTAKINWFLAELILVIMIIYAAMVYGPVAAFLVELFPTRIRYTSMSLPYHIGAGVFGVCYPCSLPLSWPPQATFTTDCGIRF